MSGLVSGAGGSDRTALQWKHLLESPDQYDAAARRFNLLPGLLPAALYQRSLQLRNLLRNQVLEACERCDVLLSPYQAAPPPRIEDTKKPLTSKAQALDEIRNFSFSASIRTQNLIHHCGNKFAGKRGIRLASKTPADLYRDC